MLATHTKNTFTSKCQKIIFIFLHYFYKWIMAHVLITMVNSINYQFFHEKYSWEGPRECQEKEGHLKCSTCPYLILGTGMKSPGSNACANVKITSGNKKISASRSTLQLGCLPNGPNCVGIGKSINCWTKYSSWFFWLLFSQKKT